MGYQQLVQTVYHSKQAADFPNNCSRLQEMLWRATMKAIISTPLPIPFVQLADQQLTASLNEDLADFNQLSEKKLKQYSQFLETLFAHS
jgi:hypothetical protein